MAPPLPAQELTAPVFEEMRGRFGFYVRCTQEQLQGNICAQPPNVNLPEGYNNPTGIDWLDGSRVVVADYGNLKLQICPDGEQCIWRGQDGLSAQQGVFRNTPGTFDKPHGVEVDQNGRLAIADEDNHAVQYCDGAGSCWYRGDDKSGLNGPRSSFGFWAFPNDVAFAPDGDILGLDTGNNRIQRLDSSTRDLVFVAAYGLPAGSGAGDLDGPRGLAVDSRGRVIITDTMNHRVLVCDLPPTSRQLACDAFGARGSGVGSFESPVGVDVDHFDRIWVADTGNHRIQVCSAQGDCVAFGGFVDVIGDRNKNDPSIDWGEAPGLFNSPEDVAVHSSGRVAVTDTKNHRIQFFRTEPAVTVNAGMNDAWGDPETPGQGFFFTVLPEVGAFFLAHFTFDRTRPDEAVAPLLGDAGQRWFTAVGGYEGNTAVLTTELTFGGVFDALEPAPEQDPEYGSYRVEFNDCRSAALHYEFPGGIVGSFPVERLTADNVGLCEALAQAGE